MDTASPAVLTGISYGAGGSSQEEESGNDPTRGAQGSTPSSFGQETGKARAEASPGYGSPGPWHGWVMLRCREHGGWGQALLAPVPKGRSRRGAQGCPSKPGGGRSPWQSSQPSQAQRYSRPEGFLQGGLPAPGFPQHRLQVGNVCFPVFLSKDSHPQHHRLGTGPRAAATPCPPAVPPPRPRLRFQQAQPQPDGNLQQRLFSAAGHPRGVGESCRAEAAAPHGAGGAPGLSRTECLRHGIDIFFFFFLSFYKETKTRVNSYEHKSLKGQQREQRSLPRGRWDGVLEGGDGMCPKVAGQSPTPNSQK